VVRTKSGGRETNSTWQFLTKKTAFIRSPGEHIDAPDRKLLLQKRQRDKDSNRVGGKKSLYSIGRLLKKEWAVAGCVSSQ